jgi:hypothetical protein
MAINMHAHWIAVIILLICAFIALQYLNLDDESKLKSVVFHSLLFVTFAASGLYLWRVIAKLPEWNAFELVGFVLNAAIFLVASWTYYHMWRSRGKKR